MKPIIPSLPFLAFPSEKVFADFRPVRGLLIETPAPTDDSDHPLREFRSLGDLLDLHDPRPLIAAIAAEMGYDTDKLAAGEGETGIPGHSWVSYCNETWLPMLVRWQAGEAQLLLTFVETHERGPLVGSDLRLTILGDEAAKPIMRRLAVALTPFHLSKPSHAQGSVEIDGKPRRMGLPEIAFSRFTATASVWATEDGQLSPERMAGEGPWGQAVPTRSLNQKPCHLGEFRFSDSKVRPDPVFGRPYLRQETNRPAMRAGLSR